MVVVEVGVQAGGGGGRSVGLWQAAAGKD